VTAVVMTAVVVAVVIVMMLIFGRVMNGVMDDGVGNEAATGCGQQRRKERHEQQGFDDLHGNAPLQVGP
jgi:hypothetical protein